MAIIHGHRSEYGPFPQELHPETRPCQYLLNLTQLSKSALTPYDLLIAAQALRTGANLVTANVQEFARIPNLLWQDWT
jgi:hypothetical protein